MIGVVLILLFFIFVLFFIVLPIFFNIFKEQIWVYVKEKLKEQEKHDRLRRDMKQRKKGNQGKTLLK